MKPNGDKTGYLLKNVMSTGTSLERLTVCWLVTMASLGVIARALIEFQHGSLIQGLAVAVVVIPLILLVWYSSSPHRPVLAVNIANYFPHLGYTNLWRLAQVRSGRYHETVKKLHDRYGPVVRIGPNLLDLDYPKLIPTIYGTDGKWRKGGGTEFYHGNSTIVNGKITYTLFSETDQAEHARMKRPVAKYFSLSHVLALEPHMDKVINDLIKQLDERFAKPGKDCDLGEWIAFCKLPLSLPSPSPTQAVDYFAAVGQMPWLDYLLDKNPIRRIGPPSLQNVTRIAVGSLAARTGGTDAAFDPRVPDYPHHFLDARRAHPDLVPDDNAVVAYLFIPLIAGADTTAITIRAVFYFVLTHPPALRRLAREVRAAGFDPVRAAPYAPARQLPYLEAVVRQAMRLHPAVAMPLERYVPEGGVALPADGSLSHVPAGAAVGVNPYAVGRNKGVWGADADAFRPERWRRAEGEGDAAYRARMQRWNAADLAFGGGSRICIGRHLALVEVYKIVATLVNRYGVELADPSREWEVWNSWFARQKGLVTRIRLRN
ncbi:hypothetical protein VTK56DRAFT_8407 [Thermocarpiscus australiensis]